MSDPEDDEFDEEWTEEELAAHHYSRISQLVSYITGDNVYENPALLDSGYSLCKMVNSACPGAIPEDEMGEHLMEDTVNYPMLITFLIACDTALGIEEVFTPADLLHRTGLEQVARTLETVYTAIPAREIANADDFDDNDPVVAAAAAADAAVAAITDKSTQSTMDALSSSCLSTADEYTPEELEKRQKRREMCVNELMQTEKKYVQDLKAVVEGYLGKITETDRLEPEDCRIIFGNIGELYSCNSAFLESLESAMECAPETIGDCFSIRETEFKRYTDYCTNQSSSSRLLDLMRETDSSFGAFLKGCQMILNQPLGLEAYLLTPLQRILKYPLLIKEIIKYSDANDAALESLKKALAVMESVAGFINEMKRETEHLDMIMRLQTQITGYPEDNPDVPELVCLGKMLRRALVKAVDKRNGRSSSGNERALFLFEQALVICKEKEKDAVYTFKEIAFVSKSLMTVSPLMNTEDNLFPWEVSYTQQVGASKRKMVYLMYSYTRGDRVYWVETLNRLVKNDLNNKFLTSKVMNKGQVSAPSSLAIDYTVLVDKARRVNARIQRLDQIRSQNTSTSKRNPLGLLSKFGGGTSTSPAVSPSASGSGNISIARSPGAVAGSGMSAVAAAAASAAALRSPRFPATAASAPTSPKQARTTSAVVVDSSDDDDDQDIFALPVELPNRSSYTDVRSAPTSPHMRNRSTSSSQYTGSPPPQRALAGTGAVFRRQIRPGSSASPAPNESRGSNRSSISDDLALSLDQHLASNTEPPSSASPLSASDFSAVSTTPAGDGDTPILKRKLQRTRGGANNKIAARWIESTSRSVDESLVLNSSEPAAAPTTPQLDTTTVEGPPPLSTLSRQASLAAPQSKPPIKASPSNISVQSTSPRTLASDSPPQLPPKSPRSGGAARAQLAAVISKLQSVEATSASAPTPPPTTTTTTPSTTPRTFTAPTATVSSPELPLRRPTHAPPKPPTLTPAPSLLRDVSSERLLPSVTRSVSSNHAPELSSTCNPALAGSSSNHVVIDQTCVSRSASALLSHDANNSPPPLPPRSPNISRRPSVQKLPSNLSPRKPAVLPKPTLSPLPSSLSPSSTPVARQHSGQRPTLGPKPSQEAIQRPTLSPKPSQETIQRRREALNPTTSPKHRLSIDASKISPRILPPTPLSSPSSSSQRDTLPHSHQPTMEAWEDDDHDLKSAQNDLKLGKLQSGKNLLETLTKLRPNSRPPPPIPSLKNSSNTESNL